MIVLVTAWNCTQPFEADRCNKLKLIKSAKRYSNLAEDNASDTNDTGQLNFDQEVGGKICPGSDKESCDEWHQFLHGI